MGPEFLSGRVIWWNESEEFNCRLMELRAHTPPAYRYSALRVVHHSFFFQSHHAPTPFFPILKAEPGIDRDRWLFSSFIRSFSVHLKGKPTLGILNPSCFLNDSFSIFLMRPYSWNKKIKIKIKKEESCIESQVTECVQNVIHTTGLKWRAHDYDVQLFLFFHVECSSWIFSSN